ncbi:MAG: energy transducer TonB [Lewinellaceae bacterium]|nr:energy transducer TonB [Lewinellaceae bacterium]
MEKDGHISGIKTITEGSQNPREDFVRESVRVIKGMPNWTPAKTDGKIVSAEVTLPIKFALDGKKP